MQALTKYMNGHTDVVMGSVVVNDDDLHKRLRFIQTVAGAVPSPFDCFLVGRGLKTLAVRMKQIEENALTVARSLEKNPRVLQVIYPGLESHPQHELCKRQSSGSGGMLSIYIKGGLEETKIFLDSIKVLAITLHFCQI
jgi:cystathionine gamma-lyase